MEVVTGAGDGVSSYMFISVVVLYIATITDAHGGCYWCWRWSKLLHVYIYGRHNLSTFTDAHGGCYWCRR